MAYAMGYMMSPLTGLRIFSFRHNGFYNELLTQDTGVRFIRAATIA